MPKAAELLGEEFGSLTVVDRVRSAPKGHVLWLCECECGRTVEVPTAKLRSGHTKSCGCRRVRIGQARLENLVGRRFHSLTVVAMGEPTGDGSRDRYWYCRCDCGGELTVRGGHLRSEHTKSCGCRRVEVSSQLNKGNHTPRLAPGRAAMNRLIADYKRGAMQRNLSWALSDEVAEEILTSPCHYCGVEPQPRSRKGFRTQIATNGIDRMTNTLGYERFNVVAACSDCNDLKYTADYEDFLDWVERVYNHSVKSASRRS
jgi:hypothetical protein